MSNTVLFGLLNIIFWVVIICFNRYNRPADSRTRHIQLAAVVLGLVGIILGVCLF